MPERRTAAEVRGRRVAAVLLLPYFFFAVDAGFFAGGLDFRFVALAAAFDFDDDFEDAAFGIGDFFAIAFFTTEVRVERAVALLFELDALLATALLRVERALALRAAAAWRERADAERALPRRLRVASTLFHPTMRSARKLAGMVSGPSGASITASAAASVRSLRTSLITFAGRRALAACTRLVSRITNISRSGSIQIDVPV